MRIDRRAALLALCCCLPACAQSPAELAAGFVAPPASARPHTWWHWMSGNISREGITLDLEAMARVGVGGAQIFDVQPGVPSGPVDYASPEWRAMVAHAAAEAKRLGIELCLHNCAGWSSSGGPWVQPEQAMQRLTWSEREVTGPARFDEPLVQPETRHGYYVDTVVLAFPTPRGEGADYRIPGWQGKACFERHDRIEPPSEATAPAGAVIPLDAIVDLTDRFADGRLTWDVPDGTWTVLRCGHTCTGAQNAPAADPGRGLEVSKLDREAIDAFWAGQLDILLDELGPLAGSVVNNVLIDSYEMGSENWCRNMPAEFRARTGYDLAGWLPATIGYVVDSLEASERFLWDFRRVICDLFAEAYVGGFAEHARARGMLLSIEGYGNGPFDNLQVQGIADIPMAEFWTGGRGDEHTSKLAASAANTYGRRYVGAEAFTAAPQQGRWTNHPGNLKALGDRMYCFGINRFIFHRYAHQPWTDRLPGMTMGPWGFHFERTSTWFEQSTGWMDYLTRCQYLLQSGRFAADLLYYYGESAPLSLDTRGGLRPSPPVGYDFDGASFEILDRITVRNGRITLPSGMEYALLVLPDSPWMRPAVARRVAEIVRAGATVYGPRPVASPSLAGQPAADAEVARLAAEVWGDIDGTTVTEHGYGAGRVVYGVPLEALLAESGVAPDVELVGAERQRVEWIHRRIGPADAWFVSNQRTAARTIEASFRLSGRQPELWDPTTGEMSPAPVWREEGGRTIVRLSLAPSGSVFVVFRDAAEVDPVVSLRRDGAELPAGAARSEVPLEIVRATYGVLANPPQCVDVTAQLRAAVDGNVLSIAATNGIAGDPAVNIVKELRVEYLLGGVPGSLTVRENELIELPRTSTLSLPHGAALTATARGVRLEAFEPGAYEVVTAAGRSVAADITDVPAASEVGGPWQVAFPAGWGAPEQTTFDTLVSWPEHDDEGIRFFSGTATYRRTLEIPAAWLAAGRRVYLDLGAVEVIARVRLNGQELGLLWTPPFRVELTAAARPGPNSLEVEVTNLWPNRLIGDEAKPDDREWRGGNLARWPAWMTDGTPRPETGRYTWTTWHHYNADSPLLPSGLIGPVRLIGSRTVELTLPTRQPRRPPGARRR